MELGCHLATIYVKILCQHPDVEYANFDGKTIDAQLELIEE